MPSSTSEGEGGSAGRERQGGGFRRAASGRSQPCRQPDLQLARPVRDLSPLVCKIINLCGFKPLHLWQFFTAAIGNYPPSSSPIHPATMSSVSYLVTCPRVSRMWVRWCRGTTELVILHRVLPTCGPARCGPAIPSDPLESWNRAHLTASRPVLRELCVFVGRGQGTRAGRAEPDPLRDLRPPFQTLVSAPRARHPPSAGAHARPFGGSAAQVRGGQASTPT